MDHKNVFDRHKAITCLHVAVSMLVFFVLDYLVNGEYHGWKPVFKAFQLAVFLGGVIGFMNRKINRKWRKTNKISELQISVRSVSVLQIAWKTLRDVSPWVLILSAINVLVALGKALALSVPVDIEYIIFVFCFYFVICFLLDFILIIHQTKIERRRIGE